MSFAIKVRVDVHVLQAMIYLHVHLDLMPANILVHNVHCDDIYSTFGHTVQGCRQRDGGGLMPPQILRSSYYVYKQLPQKDIQAVTAKGHPKCIIIEKPERKNKQLSGYKQCYTYKKSKFRSDSGLVTCNKLNPRG